ncbi:peptidyl-tRNA hydrolase, partial [Nadsonia fulvescens var. elongata DSM 6958]
DFRMALVVRTDLKMEKGKIAAQCAHAAVQNFRQLQRLDPGLINAWEMTGQAKIALKCSSLNELELLAARATDLGVLACFVRDAGRTQVMAGEVTVLGLGPARREVLDRITKDLKLY